ncbi:MAG TPA: hypothetical protein VJP77_05250 [Planctomycetota bacterium]|nr:hypothetical protein [Planctomycetota bacterium]
MLALHMLALLAPQGPSEAMPSEASAGGAGPRLTAAAGIEPLGLFVENRGQWPAEALFFARAGAIELTVLCDGFVLRPVPPLDSEGRALRETAPLFVRFVGGACAAEVVGVDPGPTRHHFFQAGGSASNALGYASVRYDEVWPGIDVVLRRELENFAYDLHLERGADLAAVALEFGGTNGASIVGGVLVLDTPEGPVEQRIGAAWQEGEHGVRTPVAPRFDLHGREAGGAYTVGFAADDLDPSRSLVVDPTLAYATYLGGPSPEQIPTIDADANGHVYLACRTAPGMPTTPGAPQPAAIGGWDAWVGKLSADGSTLEWGTYLGGLATDYPEDVVAAPDGSVIVSGMSFSDDFPVTPDALQSNHLSNSDTFLTRISADGSALVWSTYFGCAGSDTAGRAGCFSNNDVLVALEPWTSEVAGLPGGGFDAVWDEDDWLVARVAADGRSVVAATWLHCNSILAVDVDAQDNVYVAGDVGFTPAPTSPTAHQSEYLGSSGTGYAASLTADLSVLRYGTYVGGPEGSTDVRGIAVDAAGCLHVASQCSADDSPVTPGAWQAAGPAAGSCGYVAKLLPNGTGLAWATYIGVWTLSGGGFTESIVVDSAGNSTASGWANSPGWPTTSDALQPNFIGPFPGSDVALTKFDPVGEQLAYSTWFGGSGTDAVSGVALGPGSSVAIGFSTSSTDVPVTPGALDSTKDSSNDNVVAVFDLGLRPWRLLGPGTMGSVETPNLVGLGNNTPGSATRLALRGALPSVPVFLLVGSFEVNLPVFGGTLVPFPELILPMGTDGMGWKDFAFPWPPLLPGQDLTLQFWCLDPADPWGWSASNGLRALAQ